MGKKKYTDSKLVSYVDISPNCDHPRNHEIDTITIHCMAGDLSVETCGRIFEKPSRQASSNYGIDSDGRIALYCHEEDRSWCSSNAANDNRAITIEVANNGGADQGWPVSNKAMNSLFDLLVDICLRNDIKELKWKGDKKLIGQVNLQNMTVHRWFANKSCPGDWLYDSHGAIADIVNKRLREAREEMTYEEFCKFMDRYLADLKKKPADKWAEPYLKWAKEEGLIVGDNNGNQMPQMPLTTERAAAIMKAFHDKYED